MKKIYTLALVMLSFLTSKAQINTYSTSSGEIIFSFADYKIKGEQMNTPVRFTCFFHLGSFQHFDFNDKVGIYTGAAIRNVGFISTKGDSLIKRRNYYIGVPLAIKIGNLDEDTYLYAGVEGELAINYKEKIFVNEDKVHKFNVWFSNRTNAFMPSVFMGVNLKGGFNMKFKYYLSDFYNKNFVASGEKIYANTTSQMFYFSVAMNIRNSSYSRSRSTKTYNQGL